MATSLMKGKKWCHKKGRREIQHFSFLFVSIEETCHRSFFWGHLDVYSRYMFSLSNIYQPWESVAWFALMSLTVTFGDLY